MKKQSAVKAWAMLVMSLPKGIMAFVIAVVGLSVSLPLVILWVGLPMLAVTFTACCRLMNNEQQVVEAWLQEDSQKHSAADKQISIHWNGCRSLWSLLGQGRTYLGILYSLMQLPLGIVGFTLAIVLPVTAYSVMLSPLAYKVSSKFFAFDLFASDWGLHPLVPEMTSYERSWVAGVVGLVLVFVLPFLLRKIGLLYASFIQAIAARDYATNSEHSFVSKGA